MSEKILCPWCGAEMKLHSVSAIGGYPIWHNYKCAKCSSQSPHGDTREEAHKAALHRYTPPIKPMTLEEAVKKEFSYREWKDGGVDKDPILLTYIWDEWDESEKLAWQDFSESGFELTDESAYGNEWRCWERRPTREERSAAEWEN